MTDMTLLLPESNNKLSSALETESATELDYFKSVKNKNKKQQKKKAGSLNKVLIFILLLMYRCSPRCSHVKILKVNRKFILHVRLLIPLP